MHLLGRTTVITKTSGRKPPASAVRDSETVESTIGPYLPLPFSVLCIISLSASLSLSLSLPQRLPRRGRDTSSRGSMKTPRRRVRAQHSTGSLNPHHCHAFVPVGCPEIHSTTLWRQASQKCQGFYSLVAVVSRSIRELLKVCIADSACAAMMGAGFEAEADRLVTREGDEIVVDGSVLEGGGQILRTASVLAALWDLKLRIRSIRGKRTKPGLRPQVSSSPQALKFSLSVDPTR